MPTPQEFDDTYYAPPFDTVPPPLPTKFRAGDVVHHIPTKEKWLLAADERDGEVVCAGWPESIAKAKECVLVSPADDEKRKKILADVVAACEGQMRGSWARQDLLK